jgi:hypothetical protein
VSSSSSAHVSFSYKEPIFGMHVGAEIPTLSKPREH